MTGRRKSMVSKGGCSKNKTTTKNAVTNNSESTAAENTVINNSMSLNCNVGNCHKCGCESSSSYMNELRKNKLKLEIETIALAKINMQFRRNNTIFYTENLQMQIENLTMEIEALKNIVKPKPADNNPVVTEKPADLHIHEVTTTTTVLNEKANVNNCSNTTTSTPNLDVISNDNFSIENIKIENLSEIPDEESVKMEIKKVEPIPDPPDATNDVLTSYVILRVPTSENVENNDRRIIFINVIEENEINEYFEITADDPFMIQPLNKDVPMKYVDLQKIGAICSQKTKQISEGILHISIVNKTDVVDIAQGIRESNKIVLKNVTCSENIKNQIRSKNDAVFNSNSSKGNVVDLTEAEVDDEIVFFANSPEASVSRNKRKIKDPDIDTDTAKPAKRLFKIDEPDLNSDSTNDIEISVPKVEVIEIN